MQKDFSTSRLLAGHWCEGSGVPTPYSAKWTRSASVVRASNPSSKRQRPFTGEVHDSKDSREPSVVGTCALAMRGVGKGSVPTRKIYTAIRLVMVRPWAALVIDIHVVTRRRQWCRSEPQNPSCN